MAAPPPISNPSDDESGRLVASVATTTSLALAVVMPRVLVRTLMVRAFGWDDILMLLTMCTSVVGFSLIVVQAHNGAGRHRGDVDPETYLHGMKVNFINQPIYLFAICFAKLAVGAALVRIAAVGSIFKRIIYGVMGFMLFYTIACFFTIIFQCSDIRHTWNPAVPATCFDITTLMALSYTNAACNILTDLTFALFIPIPMLWKLNINKRKKASLFCVLGLGVFSTSAACVKVSYLVNYGKEGDFLWDSRNISIWTAAELNVGIIAGSLPSLKPLFKRVLGGTYARGSDQGNSGSRKYPRLSKSWHAISGLHRKHSSPDPFGDTSSEAALELPDTKMDSAFQSKERTTIDSEHDGGNNNRLSDPSSDLGAVEIQGGITKTTNTTITFGERGRHFPPLE